MFPGDGCLDGRRGVVWMYRKCIRIAKPLHRHVALVCVYVGLLAVGWLVRSQTGKSDNREWLTSELCLCRAGWGLFALVGLGAREGGGCRVHGVVFTELG